LAFKYLVVHNSGVRLSYSTVVLYIGIMKVGLKYQNQLNIYFVTSWQYWLGIAKLEKLFRSKINHSTELIYTDYSRISVYSISVYHVFQSIVEFY